MNCRLQNLQMNCFFGLATLHARGMLASTADVDVACSGDEEINDDEGDEVQADDDEAND